MAWLANHARPASPQRHPGDRGRFVAVLKTDRNRTGDGQIRCLTGNIGRLAQPFLLVLGAPNRDSKAALGGPHRGDDIVIPAEVDADGVAAEREQQQLQRFARDRDRRTAADRHQRLTVGGAQR